MKRLFDIVFSFIGIIFLLPLLILIIILIKMTTKGPFLYKQIRVGKHNKDFIIFKFRTMIDDAEKLGLLTVGERDSRITKIGYYLRKSKIDELPQIANILVGDMSFVGPRPEIRKYVELYTHTQMKVLDVRPGITDLASIEFRDENKILEKQENPDNYYINIIMPRKLQINLEYLQKRNLMKDIGLIFKTIKVILN